MSCLTPHEALQLTATFAFTADYLRSSNTNTEMQARIYETASRVAFLRASLLARHEGARPKFGEISRRAIFATA